MEFALSQEQSELVAMIGSLLAKRADSGAVRTALSQPLGYDETLWQTLCEQVGVAALGIPESYDGAGASLLEALLVVEELGRVLAPTPLVSSLLAAEALLAGGSEDARSAYLPRIAAGEVVAYADLDADATVLDADRASLLIGVRGQELVVVEEFEAAWTPSMDQTLRLGTVSFDPSAARPIGDGVPARERADQVLTVATAALAVGCAARGLAMTVAYTRERVQFGRPIGSFQALKHRMADMLVLVEMARSASWAASFAVSTGREDADQLAHVALSYAADAATHVAAETVQLHGGIAITWEHDAHLVFKRAHALSQLAGSPHQHRAALAL